MTPLIQCVPNFSEGRRAEDMDAILCAVRSVTGVRLVDWSADHDHHRMVVTFLGPPEPVREAALAVAAAAVATIDIGGHHGVHPRLGAIDVLPFIPVRDSSLAACATLAVEVGRELASRHRMPVYLYEAASPDGRALPTVRKEAFRRLPPDFGPDAPHPTAGAVVVGARGPLIAYNVNVASRDIRIAREIAREIRSGAAGLFGVRALGLALHSRGLTQVSMNITRPAETPLLSVFSYVARRARELGTEALESEIIGALPGPSAFGVLSDALQAKLKPGQVLLENWGGFD